MNNEHLVKLKQLSLEVNTIRRDIARQRLSCNSFISSEMLSEQDAENMMVKLKAKLLDKLLASNLRGSYDL